MRSDPDNARRFSWYYFDGTARPRVDQTTRNVAVVGLALQDGPEQRV